MRVAVIGSGIVGSCVGFQLARGGADVVIFDAGQPGAAVTDWSFSWLNASNKTQTRDYFDLNVAGMSAYRDLVAEFGYGHWCHLSGHLRWSDSDEGADRLRNDVEHLRNWGYAVEIWTAEQVGRLLEPEVRFPAEHAEVALYRDEGWIGGRALVALLVADAVDHGAQAHFDRSVADIVLRGDHVVAVVAAGGEQVDVDAVVNAAGPAAGQVAGLVGRALPMRDEPGLVARIRCDGQPVRRAMHAPHVEIRPDDGDRIVLHSREVDALIDPSTTAVDLRPTLVGLAQQVVPALLGAEPVGERIAWRPIPDDGFPSVGGVEGLAGYYEAVTHSGITLGPIVGRLLAEEILGGTISPLVTPYRPDRFVDSPV
ncbi:MAG TPA: FAD-binding oxidoreductase [Acidimicrobiales bacterium]|jgi:glycine/D-amino acid oxidase-like deaminating enzyme|nr:FAD-binding oxidoreductase [Acidimicrobiales bacterium]